MRRCSRCQVGTFVRGASRSNCCASLPMLSDALPDGHLDADRSPAPSGPPRRAEFRHAEEYHGGLVRIHGDGLLAIEIALHESVTLTAPQWEWGSPPDPRGNKDQVARRIRPPCHA